MVIVLEGVMFVAWLMIIIKGRKKNKIGDHDPFSTGTYLSKERQRIMDRYSNLS